MSGISVIYPTGLDKLIKRMEKMCQSKIWWRPTVKNY
jgi:hypothetical protein